MRLSLYLPVYAPVQYAGQTPVAYKRAARDKFERVLAESATNIFSHASDLLDFAAERGEIHRRAFTEYTFDSATSAKTGAILRAALDIFGLKTIGIAYNVGDMFAVGTDEVTEIEIGADVNATGT